MFCNGYYIQESYNDIDGIDFMDKDGVIEGCQDQLESMAKFCLNNEG